MKKKNISLITLAFCLIIIFLILISISKNEFKSREKSHVPIAQIEVTESSTEVITQEKNVYKEVPEKVIKKEREKSVTSGGYFTSFSSLVSALLYGSFLVAVLSSFFYIVWGGIDWIISGGDTDKISASVQKIVAAVVGLVIVSSSFAIISLVLRFLEVDSLNSLLKII